MLIRKLFSLRFAAAIVVAIALASTAFADTIRLKNGSIIKGRIVHFKGGFFTVATGEGTRRREMSIAAAEVESIEFTAENSAVGTRVPEQRSEPAKRVPSVIVTDPQATVRKAPPARETRPVEPVRQNVPDVPVIETKAAGGNAAPVGFDVKVFADARSNGWTNSGWVLKKGQKVHITAAGKVSLGGGDRSAEPSGRTDVADDAKLMKSVPTGALIAVIGDDNDEFLWIGNEREFVASRDGALFLGVNEGNLNDNSGNFDVRIEIQPGD
jgi:hypothetical protein